MNRLPMYSLTASVVLVLAAVRVAAEEFEVSGFRWQGRLAVGEMVTVKNLYGDVRVRASQGDLVQVVANIQKIGLQQDDAEIVVDEDEGSLRIAVVHPSEREPEQTSFEGRVDVSLRVPVWAAMDIRTSYGLLEARGLTGPLTAHAGSGRIEILTAGDLEVATGTGDVVVWVEPGSRTSTIRLASASGAIRLEISESMSVDLVAEASAGVAVDAPDELEGIIVRQSGRASVTAGGGKTEIRATSRSGAIQIVIAKDERTAGATAPDVVETELADLPTVDWKPGDPIREVPREPAPTVTPSPDRRRP